MKPAPRLLVLGIGNPDRGDDAAGRLVARHLRKLLPAHVDIAELDGEATSLLARLDGVAEAHIIDACASGAPAGTRHRFDVGAAPLPQSIGGLTTHGFGLAGAIELARALGQLPARCIVHAIEGGCFDVGAGLTPAVAAAVGEMARDVVAEFIALDANARMPCTKPD